MNIKQRRSSDLTQVDWLTKAQSLSLPQVAPIDKNIVFLLIDIFWLIIN